MEIEIGGVKKKPGLLSSFWQFGGMASGVLLILFIILRIAGTIDWPWLWVLSPLWIYPLVGISILIFFVVRAILFVRRAAKKIGEMGPVGGGPVVDADARIRGPEQDP